MILDKNQMRMLVSNAFRYKEDKANINIRGLQEDFCLLILIARCTSEHKRQKFQGIKLCNDFQMILDKNQMRMLVSNAFRYKEDKANINIRGLQEDFCLLILIARCTSEHKRQKFQGIKLCNDFQMILDKNQMRMLVSNAFRYTEDKANINERGLQEDFCLSILIIRWISEHKREKFQGIKLCNDLQMILDKNQMLVRN